MKVHVLPRVDLWADLKHLFVTPPIDNVVGFVSATVYLISLTVIVTTGVTYVAPPLSFIKPKEHQLRRSMFFINLYRVRFANMDPADESNRVVRAFAAGMATARKVWPVLAVVAIPYSPAFTKRIIYPTKTWIVGIFTDTARPHQVRTQSI